MFIMYFERKVWQVGLNEGRVGKGDGEWVFWCEMGDLEQERESETENKMDSLLILRRNSSFMWNFLIKKSSLVGANVADFNGTRVLRTRVWGTQVSK